MQEQDTMENISTILNFLGRRDLCERELFQEKFDLIIVLGSSFYESVQLGEKLLELGVSPYMLLSGGIGHSTFYLEKRLAKNLGVELVNGKSESEYFYDLISPEIKNKVWIENESTNCGENAIFSLRYVNRLIESGELPILKKILLIQDPTMQRRTHATYEHVWKNMNCEFKSFTPLEMAISGEIEYTNQSVLNYFSFERVLELVLGEIVRVKDDEQGYGPKGKNFIAHVDVPIEVEKAFSSIVKKYPKFKSWQKRS
ncbi:MAG: YdcF family protein [Fusobacteria bacterium]|nr:YdcF family protein [Fusobacteriota bacterium]